MMFSSITFTRALSTFVLTALYMAPTALFAGDTAPFAEPMRESALAAHSNRDLFLSLLLGFLLAGFIALPLIDRLRKQRSELEHLRHIDQITFKQKLERGSNLIEDTAVGTWEWNVQSGITAFNERWAEMVGYDISELSPTTIDTWMNLAHPDDLERSQIALAEHFAGNTDLYQCEARMRHKNGSWIWVLDTGKVISRSDDGSPLLMSGFHQDISALKDAEHLAAINERKLQNLISNLQGIAFRCRNDHRRSMLFMSQMTLTLTGYHPDQIIDNDDLHFADLIHPDCRDRVWKEIQAALQKRIPYEIEYRLTSRDGAQHWVIERGLGVWNKNNQLESIEGLITDITESKETNQALARREQELGETQRIAQLGSWSLDLDSGAIQWSDEMFSIFRLDPNGPVPSLDEHPKYFTDQSWIKVTEAIEQYKVDAESYDLELEIVRSNKELGWIYVHGQTQFDESGQACGVHGVAQDITQRKRAEFDRERFSRRLAQSSKMETVGQLTGGIAHDFNNLLAIILGNLELIELDKLPNDILREQLASINRAAQRGADLTQQLLGFSRKQAHKVQLCNLNNLIDSVKVLIARSITPAIQLVIEAEEKLWLTRIDFGEFQDAILNLTTNALDAMPKGGQLTLSTRNITLDQQFCSTHPGLTAGPYVKVSVQDTGCGMSSQQLERAFEPFFTTKSQGKGTGLGLAMVFAFAKRNQGQVIADSVLDEGTTIDLYFPRAERDQRQSEQDWRDETLELTIIGGSETILLVDDEQDLLKATEEYLTSLGYCLITASDYRQAMIQLEQHADISLLISDLVLPGNESGVDLINAALAMRPQLRVLLTTGANAMDVIGLNRQFSKPVKTLSKPFRFGELATTVRDELGQHKSTHDLLKPRQT